MFQNIDPTTREDVSREERSATIAVLGFPAFILVGAAIAFFFPEPFLPLTNYTTVFLAIIMFAMGLTLTVPDFKEVARRPLPVALGVVAQFVVMPLGAIAVAKLFGLPEALAVGLLMLGSVPGGTASNVVAYLARGDVALSVAMTSVSTLIAPIATPVIMLLLAGERTEVDAAGMAWTLLQTVLGPVVLGLVIATFASRAVAKVSAALPWVSIVGIGGVVFGAVVKNAEALAVVGLTVLAAVLAHNVLGYALGYLAAKIGGYPKPTRRTMAVEIGTQSAGLASGMAGTFFHPEAALPGAVAAVFHNITGAIYAALVRAADARAARATIPS